MSSFRVIGFALMTLFLLVVSYFGIYPRQQTMSAVARGGETSVNLQIPQIEFDTALSYAQNRAIELNGQGHRFTTWGSLGTWASFACTSAITLILGFFGRGPSTQGQPPDTSGLAVLWSRIVGLLAAAAAVLTATGSLLKDHGQTLYASSDKAVELVSRAQADMMLEGTAAAQQRAILTELRRQLDRL